MHFLGSILLSAESSRLKSLGLATIAALLLPSVAWSQAPDLASEARAFIAALVRADFAGATAQFDSTMRAALPEAKLRATWRTLQDQAGAFQKMRQTRPEQSGEYRVIFVTCEFARATLDAKVVFNQERRIAGLFFVPTKTPTSSGPSDGKPPKNVVEQALTVGAGEWALPGTLSRPATSGPAALPAIVLVHGSGPQDRDETVGANRPFRDLAWGLAAKGVAVLRYEKRTKVHAAKLAEQPALTVKEEVIDDALAAVAKLRATPGIDGARIVVLGHSLGGMLGPRIARADAGIAGLVLLAAPARPMEDLLLEQSRHIFSLDGALSPAETEQLAELQRQVDRVKKLTPVAAAAAVSVLGAPAAYWLDLRDYAAPGVARDLKQPMLILQGGRDYQVTTVDFELWRKELAACDRATLRLYPNLNHLFMAGEGRSTPAEYGRPGHVAPEVIDDIAAWVLKL